MCFFSPCNSSFYIARFPQIISTKSNPSSGCPLALFQKQKWLWSQQLRIAQVPPLRIAQADRDTIGPYKDHGLHDTLSFEFTSSKSIFRCFYYYFSSCLFQNCTQFLDILQDYLRSNFICSWKLQLPFYVFALKNCPFP